MTKKAKEIIELFYQYEDEPLLKEQKTTKISVRISYEDVAMLTCIATRFDMQRFDIIEPILNEAVSDMFFSLWPSDRQAIAKLADEECEQLMKKAGIKSVDWETKEEKDLESSHWSRHLKRLNFIAESERIDAEGEE